MECAAKPPEYRYYEDGKKTIAFAGCVGVKFARALLSQAYVRGDAEGV